MLPWAAVAQSVMFSLHVTREFRISILNVTSDFTPAVNDNRDFNFQVTTIIQGIRNWILASKDVAINK